MKSIVRTQKISIDKPFLGAEPWVALILQSIQLDAQEQPAATSARVEQINKRGSLVMAETVTFTNPMNGQEMTLTGLEVQLAIAAFSRKWIIDDAVAKGKVAYVDDQDNVIVEDF